VRNAGVEEVKFPSFDRFALFGFGPSWQKKANQGIFQQADIFRNR
jgi:hypothetical protein